LRSLSAGVECGTTDVTEEEEVVSIPGNGKTYFSPPRPDLLWGPSGGLLYSEYGGGAYGGRGLSCISAAPIYLK
jgi:hypothetical protein